MRYLLIAIVGSLAAVSGSTFLGLSTHIGPIVFGGYAAMWISAAVGASVALMVTRGVEAESTPADSLVD